MIEAAVGLGVILSLIFSELLGASAGGIVVPVYCYVSGQAIIHYWYINCKFVNLGHYSCNIIVYTVIW
ncbi:MAG TPA: hypothetical protein PKZ69_06325 [Candidatus Cloacimonadota bacterium]|nr:hypothetical protein [Candidatus Cloacimonadota bacterium]